MTERVKRIVDERYHPDGYNIGINVGEVAGQSIFHVHMHLIPRYKDDNQVIGWEPQSPSSEDQKAVLELLTK